MVNFEQGKKAVTAVNLNVGESNGNFSRDLVHPHF